MPVRKKSAAKRPVQRKRPFPIRVMASAAEKKTLVKAAKMAGRPLTRLVLELALAEVERGK
jgi:uncharacterized protein (DUF1778 family)